MEASLAAAPAAPRQDQLGASRGRVQAWRRSARFRGFSHAELVSRNKVNLGISWLKDDALDDAHLLHQPGEIAAEIVENLEAALERFCKVALGLQPELTDLNP